MHRSIPLLLAAVVALAGCGGDDKPDDAKLVRDTLDTFATSVEKREYAKLCDEVFSPELLEGLQSIGLPCEVAMKNSFAEVENPRLTVGKVEVDGDEATAEIKTSAEGQPPASNDLHLEKIEGKWRVSDLSEAPAEATPTATATAED